MQFMWWNRFYGDYDGDGFKKTGISKVVKLLDNFKLLCHVRNAIVSSTHTTRVHTHTHTDNQTVKGADKDGVSPDSAILLIMIEQSMQDPLMATIAAWRDYKTKHAHTHARRKALNNDTPPAV